MDKYDTLEYSRVKATMISVHLWIYLCAFKNTNMLFGAVAKETIGVKILILILMSSNLVITTLSRITHVLLNCGKDRTADAIVTFRQVSTRKKEKQRNIKEPRVSEHS